MNQNCSCKSETFSTLRFAQRAKAIKNKAIVNEEVEDDVNHLREVIRQLRVDSCFQLLIFLFKVEKLSKYMTLDKCNRMNCTG